MKLRPLNSLQAMTCGALLLASVALPARATVIDAISGNGPFNFSGTLTSGNQYDWFTFYGTAGTPVTLEVTAPTSGFDSYLSLFRTGASAAVAGNDSSSFTLVSSDDDAGAGSLSKITNTLALSGYYLIQLRPWSSIASSINYTTGSTGNITTGPGGSAVPDGGSTLALLGLTLAGIAGFRRKFGV